MKEWIATDYPGVSFGQNVKILADTVEIGDGAKIGDNVTITARSVRIGQGTRIERGVSVCGLGQKMDLFAVGDHALIGFENQIFCPHFSMGDYSELHNTCLSSGYKPLTIGHNCWIGQNTILNCTERLKIGKNVRIGTQSQLWTHVASGELLEGCTLYNASKLELEDDVWVVGGAVISPGLNVKKRSIIMTGAVLTKSTEPGHTYAGIPASDITAKLSFWKNVSVTDKVEMMNGFVCQFLELYPQYQGKVLLKPTDEEFAALQDESIAIFETFAWDKREVPANISIFDLTAKTYNKTLNQIEVDFLKFNVGYRARFTPHTETNKFSVCNQVCFGYSGNE